MTDILPVVMLPPSILVIVAPPVTKFPLEKVTSPENSVAFTGVAPVAVVVVADPEVSLNTITEEYTLSLLVALCVGGDSDHPLDIPDKAPVDQVIVAAGADGAEATAGFVYIILWPI